MQKRFLRKAAFTLIMLLILVSASSALATTASKTYTGNVGRSAVPVEVPSLHLAKMTTRVLYLRYLVWNDIRL